MSLDQNQKHGFRSCGQDSMANGRIKINVDGSKEGDHGLAGYGGVMRDEECTWIKGFMGQIGYITILKAEHWAIHRDLVILYEDNPREAIIETDFQEAINFIRDPPPQSFYYTNLVTEIRGLLQMTNSETTYIPRENNEVADALSKMGRNQSEILVVIENPRAELASVLI